MPGALPSREDGVNPHIICVCGVESLGGGGALPL